MDCEVTVTGTESETAKFSRIEFSHTRYGTQELWRGL